ncbi:sugar ABC transporter ATP-binding protein [Aurantimonas sp. VKM B-3413]|uniref:sugar ABC transporter ATP-binding protein n=1 Tax=Aurantimonas sp. VKM B-3413 TaxID=2779401 RepID=UPI001E54C4EA|nr:sugar ABC transporter ATP-binding protein [Aurantimonas sp. VKM B-3413]MCB8836401.1 sugar ABC transporter ATP-binding protein [Aurantimonas sp. VKM B-3413]
MQHPAGHAGRAMLELRQLERSFGPNRVLKGVDLDVRSGEVVVLMGANGAGKSTLVKIIAGVHKPGGGTLTLAGAPYSPERPIDAVHAGLCVVHQAINDGVAPDLSVAQNLLLDRLCSGKAGLFFSRSAARRQAREIQAILGLDLPLDRAVRDIPLADRQLVAICRALAEDPKVLVLDEPTSSLSQREAERLFGIVETLRARGVAILYISHRMSDIRRLADRIVTLRDGRITGVFSPPLDYEGAVVAMLGDAVQPAGSTRRSTGEVVLSVRDCRLRPWSKPFSLDLHAGEVTAITGLVGTGKSEFAEILFGSRRPVSGEMTIRGRSYRPGSSAAAIRDGVFMAAKDRATNSLIPAFDIARNLSLPFLSRHSRAGFVDFSGERRRARQTIAGLGIVCRGESDPMAVLSGGNQQKVVVGRWLSEPCEVLILDEPFQGVDIRARTDIGRRLRETAEGRATLVLAAELDEALEVADRLLVMSDHTIVGDHRTGPDLDMAQLLAEVAGSPSAAGEDAAHRLERTA